MFPLARVPIFGVPVFEPQPHWATCIWETFLGLSTSFAARKLEPAPGPGSRDVAEMVDGF